MLYVRRFGAFLPVVSLVTSSFVAYLAKDYMAARWPEHWKIILIPIVILLFVAIYLIFYLCNAALIRLTGKADLVPRLEKRWRDEIGGVAPAASPKEDYVDKVADWHLRISMPARAGHSFCCFRWVTLRYGYLTSTPVPWPLLWIR